MKKKTLLHKVTKHIKSPPISAAIDILVILSIILSTYSLYQSYKMDAALNKMDSLLNLMNVTLKKNSDELDSHIKSTYPDILAAHMEAANGMPINSSDKGICTQP
jgi:hypothetical protein